MLLDWQLKKGMGALDDVLLGEAESAINIDVGRRAMCGKHCQSGVSASGRFHLA